MNKLLLTFAVAAGAFAAASFSATAMPLAAPQASDLVQQAQYAPGPIFFRNGQQCQRSSMGVVVCRPVAGPRPGYDRGDRGYGRGYDRDYDRPRRSRYEGYGRRGYENPNPVFYRNGRQCQRSSMGVVVCR